MASKNLPVRFLGRQSLIAGSGPCLGLLGLSSVCFRQFSFLGLSFSSLEMGNNEEGDWTHFSEAGCNLLIPCSPLPLPILKVLGKALWLMGVCYEVSSNDWLPSPLPVL